MEIKTPPLVNLFRKLVAECLGTGTLLAAVVGSGIMAERLADGNIALALLANTLATAAMLFVLIIVFGPLSGAHFNPAVTLYMALRKRLAWGEASAYVAVQVLGGIAGVVVAHLMFGLPVLDVSQNVRSGPALMFSEFVAAFGLLAVIWGTARQAPALGAACVAAHITGAYWFTASTSFANPAVTLARALSDTFAGIQPADVPAFIVAQVLGALCATVLFGWLVPADR